ncbi:MAG TPA: ribonuclease J [Acidimicrobiia bacterium]|nr:ribonuclease J [Acidimicrobiia bacterium]
MTIQVTFLGGLGEIGRNCAALEVEGRIALIDCGLMFPEEEMLGVDLVFPDWSWLIERRQDLACVVLTHGHEDHVGALAYFLADLNVPVFGTRLTLELARGRIDELGVEGDLRPVEVGKWIDHDVFRFMFIDVTHSVPDACSVAFATGEGVVLHSGDFKLDPTPIDGRRSDLPGLADIARQGVRLLLSDSTNAERPGFVPSESSLAEALRDIIGEAPGRVIAACFSSHIHRIQQIADAGLQTGRQLAVFGRSLQRNWSVAQELGRLSVPPGEVVDIVDLLQLPPRRQLLLTTGSQGEPFAALSLIAQGRHKFVQIEEGDTVLISATPVPGNETAVSRVINQLLRRGARVVHGRNAQVHVSGHAARDELLTYLNLVRPRAFVPVHGEYRHLAAHADLARKVGVEQVEVCEDGDTVVIEGGELTVLRRNVPAGYVYLDGDSFGEVKAVLRDRSHLADEGVVVVTVAVSPQSREIIFGPELNSHGVMDEPEAVLGKAAQAVRQLVEERLAADGHDATDLQQAVRQAAARVIKSETSRRPVIIPVVMEL